MKMELEFKTISGKEVDKALTGPRNLKPKDSKEYAIQTLSYIKRLWESRQASMERWKRALIEAEESEIWLALGLKSLDDLLIAEIGITKEQSIIDGRNMVQDVTTQLKDFAKYCWGEHGTWAYNEWEKHNEKYFKSQLKIAGIVWGLTPHGHLLGYYSHWSNVITLHSSLIEPKSSNPWYLDDNVYGKKYASDILLHEMMHQTIHQNYSPEEQNGKSSHNNPAWVAEVNRISKLLGFNIKASLIKQKRINGKVKWTAEDGCIENRKLSQFPYGLRQAGYYQKM